MGKVRFRQSISLDGYVAGPDQSEDNPIGVGGMDLHDWMFALESWRKPQGLEGGEVNASTDVVAELEGGYGAVVMGRNMFGPIRGDWGDGSWKGWWGDEPPFHAPVFVLTHHEREPVEMQGGTTFNFVTDGIESALDGAREAAGDEDVQVSGGASTIRQYLNAGLIDEFDLHLVPQFLAAGERLFEGVDPDLKLEQLRVIEAPGVTHLKYRVPS